MLSYTIFREADNTAFKNICIEIEANYSGLKKEELLIDVDGTLIQIYRAGDQKIKVVNDYEVDAVYVDSDVDLSDLLKSVA